MPERFGLFTLILLGEAVVALMRGMESQENWPIQAAAAAITGMAVLFLVCWWYFDSATAEAVQPIRSRRDAVLFQIWSYAHLPLYLGVAVAGVRIERVVTTAAHTSLAGDEKTILAGAAAVVVGALLAIGATSGGGHFPSRRRALTPLVEAWRLKAVCCENQDAINQERSERLAFGVISALNDISFHRGSTSMSADLLR